MFERLCGAVAGERDSEDALAAVFAAVGVNLAPAEHLHVVAVLAPVR